MALISVSIKLLTIAAFIHQKDSNHKLNSNRNEFNRNYDFIVVGSGSAGAIVAHRLAETSGVQVLLLEAGGANGLVNDIPAEYVTLFLTEQDWNYTMAKQFVGKAFEDGLITENRGKVLGGCSSVNAMIFNRGNYKTFDEWAQVYGAQGWGYEDILPYFKKYENNLDRDIVGKGRYHGTDGPIHISSWKESVDPIIAIHQKALNDWGIPTTDINGAQQRGTAIAQAFIDGNGVRSSSANTYLDPNPYPNNLHILTNAMVTKVLFNGKTATGVEFVKNGQVFDVFARKEVIISAGAINSPQLLMVSGIGPKAHLDQFKIPVVADLPVGQNLQNHPALDINIKIREQYQNVLAKTGISDLTVDNLYEYTSNGSGVLSKYYNSITYLSTKSNTDLDFPNVAFESVLLKFPETFEKLTVVKYSSVQEWNRFKNEYLGKYYLFVQPILERIRSFGYIRLKSNNPFVYPEINPKFLTHPQDLQDFIDITKFVFYFFERSGIAPYVEPMKQIPGCRFCQNQRHIYECDSYIKCLVEQLTYTGYHPVGTCRMGDVNRHDVVVDHRLRVKGINSLRVCDASVMPTITNGNTNAPTLMIGEKCADLIKQDNNLSPLTPSFPI